ncbi:hypothetical protein, partial, partial [Absidia glauca]
MPPKPYKSKYRKRSNNLRTVLPSPDIPVTRPRGAKRIRWNLQFEDRTAVGAPAVGAPAVGAFSSAVSAVDDVNVAPPATVEDHGPEYDDYDFGYDHGDDDGAPDAGSSLDKKAADDARWLALLDKLVLAYKISCASKMPEPAMDQAPSFGCGCDHPTATRSVTCYYVTGVITRNISFCRSCHGGDEAITLLKQYHLFPASPKFPRTAFHVELLGLFGDARNVLFASIDGFSKIWAHRFYGGK